MTRTVSGIVAAAVAQDVTTPVHLIRMGWDTEQRICTWDANITWNSETWTASGAEVKNISAEGGVITLPNGDGDPWLALVNSEIPLDRTVSVYEHHTSTDSPSGSDATLIFTGRMDRASIQGMVIRIDLIEGRSKKGFPPGAISPSVYNHLLPVGTKLYWNSDVLTVN